MHRGKEMRGRRRGIEKEGNEEARRNSYSGGLKVMENSKK